MKLETLPLDFYPYTLSSQENHSVLKIEGSEKAFRISRLQASYLEYLKTTRTIESLFGFFLNQGWLVNFRELYGLLSFCAQENFISTPDFKKVFAQFTPHTSPTVNESGAPTQSTVHSLDLKKFSAFPFVRNLPNEIQKILFAQAKVIQLPANTRLIETGKTDRKMYLVLEGEVNLYRVLGPQQRILIQKVSNQGLIGEGGFLLNKPRTADAITQTPTTLVVLEYTPVLNDYINTQKAEALQHRFWILQALQNSDFFSRLPAESIDQITFAGQLFRARATQQLFEEGQSSRSCFILVQGKIRITQANKNIAILNSGSCFGEISLLLSGGRRTASAICETDSLILEIPMPAFYKIMAQNLYLAKEIEEVAHQRLLNDKKRAA